MSYYFRPTKSGRLLIHEEVATYEMSEADIRAALAYVKAHVYLYGDSYQERVTFYEEALKALQEGANQ